MTAAKLSLLLFAGTWCQASALRSDVDLTEDKSHVIAQARSLLVAHTKFNLSDSQIVDAFKKDPELEQGVADFVEGDKVSSALVQRARGVLGASEELDAALGRKETPCHCVIKKAKDVQQDGWFKFFGRGTNVNLDLRKLPVVAHGGEIDLKFVRLQAAAWGNRGGGDCPDTCLNVCRKQGKYHIDSHELDLLGAGQARTPMVGAQCTGKTCKCLDMDETKIYLHTLKMVQEGGYNAKLDVASKAIENYPTEIECMNKCKRRCEKVEDRVEGRTGKGIDWEGVCFDELRDH